MTSEAARAASGPTTAACRRPATTRMPAASSARPPPPVTISACVAARRAAGRSCSNPISRYDVNPVSSQNTNSTMTLSLRTRPSMDPMNANNATWNLADVGMALEVLPRVDDDQRANGSDQDREQHTQAIEPKRQRQIECWSPGCRDAERPAAADDRERVREVARERRRDSGEQQRPNTSTPQPAGERQRQKRGQDDGDVKCCRRHVRP